MSGAGVRGVERTEPGTGAALRSGPDVTAVSAAPLAGGGVRAGLARVDAGAVTEALGRIPLALAASPLLLLAGIAILAWDYALLPPDPLNHALYWLGLGLAYAGVVALGASGNAGARRHLLALALLGVVMWLPTFLRSPDRLVFVDELFHRDVLARILETGHATGQPVTLFPLPGTFPGLENVAVGLMGWTGLSMDATIRAVTLLIHATIPPVAYLAVRGVGLGRRGAFVAGLVYAANTSFPFFHSVFSYETLGILLFLSVWALVGLYRGAPRPRRVVAPGDLLALMAGSPDPDARAHAGPPLHADRRRWVLVLTALPLVAGIAVTHHVSSYMLAISLVVAWLAARFTHARSTRGIRDLAVLTLVAAGAWLVVAMDRVGPYLWNSVAARVETIVTTLFVERSQPRALFSTADQPQLERMLAFSYPVLILVLSVLGLWVAWRHRSHSVLWLPFALVGPVAWLATTPAVITRSGELAYRAWPFLFLGVGVFVALGLLELGRRAGARWPGTARPVVFVAVGALLFGAVSIGEHQAGRFPTAPTTAAGGAANTPDVVAAADWLLASAGPGNVIATDVGTAVPFATEGRQRILPWQSWYPFLAGDPARIAAFLRETGTRYLVLDRRITELPPRYGTYFGAPPVPADLDPGAPIPVERLAVLDEVPSLERVYAGPNIVIWRVTDGAPSAGGGR